jgi:4-hydroxy-3-methylbut-2-en-1-yl diphosphate reductase
VLDVIEALRRHGEVNVETMDGVRENIEFRLPTELRTEEMPRKTPATTV